MSMCNRWKRRCGSIRMMLTDALFQDIRTPQLWKNVFLCGTELEQMEEVRFLSIGCSMLQEHLKQDFQIYKIQWDFSHLDKELQMGRICCKELLPSHMVRKFEGIETSKLYVHTVQTTNDWLAKTSGSPVLLLSCRHDLKSVSLPEKVGLNSVQMVEEKVRSLKERAVFSDTRVKTKMSKSKGDKIQTNVQVDNDNEQPFVSSF
eukprot:751437-Hanusia_phi.AAC.1